MLWSRSCINSSGMTTELPTSSTQEGVQHHYYLYVQTHTERGEKDKHMHSTDSHIC